MKSKPITTAEARTLMVKAIEVMKRSLAEKRNDGKVAPLVGAVIRFGDGTIATGFRGELREGDHAEYTIIERKCRDRSLAGAALFATLEPCAPGSRKEPKRGCAERIVAARIKKVWVGIEDPDPMVDRQGIAYLEANGVEVAMFDRDLQQRILAANEKFLNQAIERANGAKRAPAPASMLSALDGEAPGASMSDLDPKALERYCRRLRLGAMIGAAPFRAALARQGLTVTKGTKATPTGFGVLLFGKRPREFFPQAGLVARVRLGEGGETTETFDGPLVEIPHALERWLKRNFPMSTDRSQMVRRMSQPLPFELIREAVINALVHRDYSITGAKCQLTVDSSKITVRSPGAPLPPISMDQMQSFAAPTLSRNPRVHYVFRQIGLAEEAGFGMSTLVEVPKRLGLPLPKYEFSNPYLDLTIFRSAEAAADVIGAGTARRLRGDERRGWMALAGEMETTMSEYAERLKIDRRKAQRHLQHFVKLGLLQRVGSGPATRYKVVDR